jgi:exodeoxyribonuclease (lambda-induced)
MQLHKTLEQGSAEWHDIRLGKLTGSSAAKLFGTPTAREKYLYDRAAEIVTGCRCDSEECGSSVHTARGHEFEEVALIKYTVATLNEVQRVGFVQLNEFVGCSPDGLIGDNGMIEIKVPDSNNYFRQLLELNEKGVKAIPSEYYYQMQFNMFVCGRNWCDYVLYNPKHEGSGKSLFIRQVERDDTVQERISSIIDESIAKIKSYTQKYYRIN